MSTDLLAGRAELMATGPRQLDSVALRCAWQELHENWLIAKASEIGVTADSGFALVATGSLGRRELLPYSDLDLLLLHGKARAEAVAQTADLLWYPLWDANIRLDHSVRTVDEALRLAAADVSVGLAMLEARHIAGDERLSTQLVDGARRAWRNGIRSRFDGLVEAANTRWRRSGEIAHCAEPDLKSGRGGLRDVQLLQALAFAQLADRLTAGSPGNRAGTLTDAYRILLDVRTELHRVSGNGHDRLLAQCADEISAALNIGDRFDLSRTLSDVARTIASRVDAGLRTAANALPRRGISALRPRSRRPLDEGVVEFCGEVVLARDVRPETDPGLVLRAAAVSAVNGIPIAESTLNRLAVAVPQWVTPWPREALENLLVLLGAGPATVPTIEALDRTGLWGRLFPQWAGVRDLPPRDAVHVWTVDRHLIETVVAASLLTTRVARPDLLLLGALLHDLGKGRGVDHSVAGAELAGKIGADLGLPTEDIRLLSGLVRNHLLLAEAATRRDLHDPATIAAVCRALNGDAVLLDILHALTEADAQATGPGMWSDWKASLVDDLVRHCRLVMAGKPLPCADPIDAGYFALAADRGTHVQMRRGGGRRDYRVAMIARNQPGLLSKAAGVLVMNSLRVHSASVNIHDGVAIDEFVVSPQFGSPVAAELLREQFVAALAGQVDVLDVLQHRDRDRGLTRVGEMPTGVPAQHLTAPGRVLWLEAPPGRLVLEIRAADGAGLLARLTGALERAGAEVAWARVTTLGSMVNDVFCVEPPGGVAEVAARAAIEREVFTALGIVDAATGPPGRDHTG